MLKRSTSESLVNLGGDSETFSGPPITFQFFGPKKYIEILWTSEKNSTKDFFNYLESLPSNHSTYVIWVHNLSFDMVSFFYSIKHVLKDEVIDFQYDNWKINGIYSNLVFLNFYNKNGCKTVLLRDTAAFFSGSLESNAKIFCSHLPKLKKPEDLGNKRFKKSDKNFINYAMRDSEITYHIGQFIIDMHYEYDIALSVSGPQMGSKIFRKFFMKKDIPLPSKKITFASLHSYHGGRNNLTVDLGLYPKVYGLDIISAYPWAMAQLPSMYHKNLYKTFKYKYKKGGLIPDLGIYKISGYVEKCQWPCLYDENFKAVTGNIKNIWVTGYELNTALQYKELTLKSVSGYYYDAKKDKDISPFKEYVNDFFIKKSTEKDDIKRQFWKICLNSIYGKFIQTVDKEKNNEIIFDLNTHRCISKSDRVAGGLFHPFIASIITGMVRAKIHVLEHKYKSIHTSTDGIITQIKPKQNDLINELGGLKLEFQGNALIFRNKLYVIFKDGKLILNNVIKYALHGFHGNLKLLLQLWRKGVYDYEYIKVNKLKESLKRGLIANKFETRQATLKLGDK